MMMRCVYSLALFASLCAGSNTNTTLATQPLPSECANEQSSDDVNLPPIATSIMPDIRVELGALVSRNYSEFFCDPESDILTFTQTGPVPAGVVFLPPYSIWGYPRETGKFEIHVSVTDSKHDFEIGSPSFNLIVSEAEEF